MPKPFTFTHEATEPGGKTVNLHIEANSPDFFYCFLAGYAIHFDDLSHQTKIEIIDKIETHFFMEEACDNL